jgi:hypothetical protein
MYHDKRQPFIKKQCNIIMRLADEAGAAFHAGNKRLGADKQLQTFAKAFQDALHALSIQI